MKKLIKIAAGIVCLSGLSQAATVAVSTGLAGTNLQGVTLETSTDHSQLLNSTSYYVGVGRFASGIFTPWTDLALDSAAGSPSIEVSGSYTTTTGGAFDGLGIQVFVGVLSSAPSTTAAFTPVGAQWTVFGSTSNPLFPVSSGTNSVTFNMTTPASLTIVATGDVANAFNGTSAVSGSATNYFTLVPEPSAALLGAIGALGLLRRRRI